jgi:hypothetical protein
MMSSIKQTPASATAPEQPIHSIDGVVRVFREWLYLPDPAALKLTLATIAANRRPGDPLWLLLVGPTGSGKTELLDSLLDLPHTHEVGTLTEASLLSGSPRRETAKDASGGILRRIGEFGFLILKDFTSVLSTSKEIRGPLLAALREIHDGHWARHVGTDGGRTVTWQGKCVLLAGCTPTIEQHRSLMAAMGERFVFSRMPLMPQKEQAKRAMEHVNKEAVMRKKLRAAVAGLFDSLQVEEQPFSQTIGTRMAALATFAARARSAVERDPYRREIEHIPDSEMPARLACTLKALFQGLRMIHITEDEAWRLTVRVAIDSIPEVRRLVLEHLQEANQPIETSAVADALNYPTTTIRRTLEDLTGHSLLQRFSTGAGKSQTWQVSSLFKELLGEAEVIL